MCGQNMLVKSGPLLGCLTQTLRFRRRTRKPSSLWPSLRVRMLSSSSPSSNPKPNPNFQMHKSGNPMNTMKTCCSSASLPGFRVSNPHTFPCAMTLSSLANPNPVLVQAQVHSASAEEESGSSPLDPSVPLVVVSFYKFADFPDHSLFRKPLKDLCQQLRVSGGIILAPEGINGSICGTRESVKRVLEFIQNDDRLKGLRQVESPVSPEEEAIHHGHSSSSPLAAGEDAPFRWDHVRVKLKKEIVSLGMPDVSPAERVGTYVRPKDWNALITDPDTVVIDVRNNYETRIGKFKGAVDPYTTAFREFPSWVDNQFQGEKLVGGHSKPGLDSLDGNLQQDLGSQANMPSKVAMYCTGGIRCEKASSFLLSKGFKEVYHLEGGILKYLEEVPKTESLWEGECFVFDKRVSVGHGLAHGTFKLCYGCKQPVSDADTQAAEYEYGVSCPYCYSLKSDEEKERARARQWQFETWGIIGGPDKGRRPTSTADKTKKSTTQLSNSV